MFRCNNCDAELPIEQLRVTSQSQDYRWRSWSRTTHLICLEMLLCPSCQQLWHHWMRHSPSVGKPERGRPLTVAILDLADWCHNHYWKQRILAFKPTRPVQHGLTPFHGGAVNTGLLQKLSSTSQSTESTSKSLVARLASS